MHAHEMRKNLTLPEFKLHEGMYILAIYIYIYLLESSSTSDYLPLTVLNRHNSVGVSINSIYGVSSKRKLLVELANNYYKNLRYLFTSGTAYNFS